MRLRRAQYINSLVSLSILEERKEGSCVLNIWASFLETSWRIGFLLNKNSLIRFSSLIKVQINFTSGYNYRYTIVYLPPRYHFGYLSPPVPMYFMSLNKHKLLCLIPRNFPHHWIQMIVPSNKLNSLSK